MDTVENLHLNIENLRLILQSASDQSASAAVLSISNVQSDGPPFVGRQAELAQLHDFLTSGVSGESVAVVTGTAGVGKSALARQAAAKADSAGVFTYSLFVDMRGYEDTPGNRARPEGAYPSLLQRLGVTAQDLPATPAEQATLYHEILNALAAQGKSVLLWIDNVSDTAQYEPLKPPGAAHKMLLTTRETFGGLPRRTVVDLEVLDHPEAIELLQASLTSRNPGDSRLAEAAEATSQLVAQCDHLPLALQIVGALLADEPQRTVEHLVRELADEEHRLDGLHYDDRLSVRAALNLSYRRLPAELQRLFRLLSIVPGGDVGLDAARWLTSSRSIRPQLMALVRAHLIQQHVQDR